MESSESTQRFGGPPSDRRRLPDGRWGLVLCASRIGQMVSVLAPVGAPRTNFVAVYRYPEGPRVCAWLVVLSHLGTEEGSDDWHPSGLSTPSGSGIPSKWSSGSVDPSASATPKCGPLVGGSAHR